MWKITFISFQKLIINHKIKKLNEIIIFIRKRNKHLRIANAANNVKLKLDNGFTYFVLKYFFNIIYICQFFLFKLSTSKNFNLNRTIILKLVDAIAILKRFIRLKKKKFRFLLIIFKHQEYYDTFIIKVK